MRGDRVYDPYPEGSRWRVVYIEGGARGSRKFATEKEAQDFASDYRAALKRSEVTVAEAIEEYLGHLVERGKRPTTVATVGHRLRAVLTDPDEPVEDITVARARQLAEAYLSTPRDRGGQKPAAETARSTLSKVRAFGSWAVKRRYAPGNPWEALELDIAGAPRRRKPQLRIDESRRFAECAHAEAEAGDDAATAALVALYLGLRASEIVARDVRDLDDGGRVLWIDTAKTAAGERWLEVPPPLQPLLVAAAKGRVPDAPLLGGERRTRYWVYYHVRRLCRLARVPRVPPHGLRGTHDTLAREAGATGHLVASALGHADGGRTSERHYADPGAVERARQRRALRVLTGGRR